MDRRDISVPTRVRHLWLRLRGKATTGGRGDADSKRYRSLLKLVVVVGMAFSGAVGGLVSTMLDSGSQILHAGGPALLETLWPVLVGVTAIAVVVCGVVVVLGVRNT